VLRVYPTLGAKGQNSFHDCNSMFSIVIIQYVCVPSLIFSEIQNAMGRVMAAVNYVCK
jgi:hypothetical protein